MDTRSYAERSLEKHDQWRGKIEIVPRSPVSSKDELSLAYTPGVAEPCLEIQRNPERSFDLTRRWNLCLVVTDGTAVLGLGDIGPEAAMPVMEGKCALFKAFGDVDAFPLCLRTKDVDEIVHTIQLLAGSFGGINLEDIAAPRCFEIEKRLKETLDIPVFHDDQHGTAVVTYAGLINALKITERQLENCRIVINGAGAAAQAIARLLISAGATDVVLCDRTGIISKDRQEGMNDSKRAIAALTNPRNISGTLKDAVRESDVFIGVSAPHVLVADDIRTMRPDPIVMACANPVPEIEPDEARKGGARVIATGRSDHPNQVNNVLAFPGIFRGAFDVRASEINQAMNIAAAHAIASLVSEEERAQGRIMPDAFDPRVKEQVSKAVSQAARETGVARR